MSTGKEMERWHNINALQNKFLQAIYTHTEAHKASD